jgi:hypothetical protein
VVKASEDLPDQLTPVRTVRAFLVKEISTSRRLCVVTQNRSIVLDIKRGYISIGELGFFSNFLIFLVFIPSHWRENSQLLLLLKPF